MLKALKSIQNNVELRKEFYKTFWNKMKHPFLNSIMEAREEKELSTFQRQAVIKLID